MPSPRSEITRLLKAWSDGDRGARELLIPLVFDELRRIARHQLSLESPDHTLQPTALVHELYLKLVDQKNVHWENRRDFFAISATLIRRILVDHARKRQASKRGSGRPKISFDEIFDLPIEQDPHLIALDDGLRDLENVDQRGSRVVELHVFGGLTFDEVADVVNVSRATVMRDWNHAKLWLRRHLSGD